MNKVLLLAIVAGMLTGCDAGAGMANVPDGVKYKGTCQHEWQIDKAGHRCGKRAAEARPGGY